MKPSMKILATVGGAAMLLAACGGNNSAASTSPATSVPPVSTSARASAPAGAPSTAASTSPSAKPSASTPAASSASAKPSAGNAASTSASGAASASTGATDSKAADFRVALNNLLHEHIYLTSQATGSAIEGNTADFNAYAKADKDNGFALGKAVGSLYGADAEKQFNDIWQQHIGFFVDYTQADAKGDEAAKQKAATELTNTYTPRFVDFLAPATGLPKDALTKASNEHLATLEKVIDDQAKKDYTSLFTDMRAADAHMGMLADTLAPAIVKKNAAKLPGDPMTKGATLRVNLDNLLEEHVFLTSFATDAAIEGKTDIFTPAAAAVKANGMDLGKAVGSVYGADAQKQFDDIWNQHIGFFVDYATGVAENDAAMKQKAANDLTNTYTPRFVDFLAGATGLPKDALTKLSNEHLATLEKVIDEQGAKNYTAEAPDAVAAGMHMDMIAAPLSQAIVKKFPNKF